MFKLEREGHILTDDCDGALRRAVTVDADGALDIPRVCDDVGQLLSFAAYYLHRRAVRTREGRHEGWRELCNTQSAEGRQAEE